MAKEMAYCMCCGVTFVKKRNQFNIYCSNKCQKQYESQQRINEWLLTGKPAAKAAMKAFLFEEQGGKCAQCGIPNVWNGKPLVFDLEHKDGNSKNDVRENLELICPNCHSQTDTYKGKNRGNGRHSRMQRYYDGKSY